MEEPVAGEARAVGVGVARRPHDVPQAPPHRRQLSRRRRRRRRRRDGARDQGADVRTDHVQGWGAGGRGGGGRRTWRDVMREQCVSGWTPAW